MKKLLFFALLAGIAVMTGCEKDQYDGTLKAVIDQDTKAYFGTLVQPYWNSDDEVYVNDDSYPLTFSNPNQITTFATIEGVDANSVYCAIYPAGIVEKMSTPNASSTTATIYFAPHQKFIWEGDATTGHQRINMPMGAITTGNTLYFKNLCSILRLNLTYGLANRNYDVKRITVQAFGAYLAGFADVTLSATNTSGYPAISMTGVLANDDDNVISLYKSDYTSMGTITSANTATNPKSFDIVVPPFVAEYIVIEVEMYDPTTNTMIGYSSNVYGRTSDRPNDARVSLGRNQIINITLGNNYNVFTPDYAYLEPGSGEEGFNHDIRALIGNRNVTAITINTSYEPSNLPNPSDDYSQPIITNIVPEEGESWVEGWVEVQDVNSPIKIYAHLIKTATDQDGHPEYTVEVVSSGTYIYANADCSMLFQDITTLKSVQWITSATTGFQTEDVTDMSFMFAGCKNLNNVQGLTDLNLTNVTTMAHMFDGCSKYNELDLSGLKNTHNLRNTEAMFQNCRSLVGLNLGSLNMDRITNKTNMCKNISADKTWNYSCALTCTGSVQTALLEKRYVATNNDPDNIVYYGDVDDEDNNSNTLYYYYITGINPIKIDWHTSK